jgi:hypothetical protein
MTSSVYAELWRAGPTREIIVVRDYYNLLASRLAIAAARHGTSLPPPPGWYEPGRLAQAWLEDVQFLTRAAHEDPPLWISFNDWFSSSHYRTTMAERLDLPNCDSGIGTVQDYGFGSSFNSLAFDGRAGKMNVLARWLDLPPTLVQTFRRIVHETDEQVRHMNSELFDLHQADILASL